MNDVSRLRTNAGLTQAEVRRAADTLDSDLDLLVTLPTDAGLLAVSSFATELEDLLGVAGDVVSDRGLSPGHHIVDEARAP